MPHILVVDDDAQLARLMRSVLSTSAVSVTVCNNGQTGIDAARQHAPDLVLLDVNIPGAHGFEVCRAIRESESLDRRSTIVMITGRHDTASKLLAFSVGADDYLVKPIDVDELRTRVARWIETRAQYATTIMRRRQEAIQEIVTAICHEVNNPLTVALIGLDLVLARGGLPQESAAELDAAREHLLRIGDVLQSLQSVRDRTVPYVGADRMIDVKSLPSGSDGEKRADGGAVKCDSLS